MKFSWRQFWRSITGKTERDLRDLIEEYRKLTTILNQENSDLKQRNANLNRQILVIAAPRGSGQAVVGWEAPGLADPQFALLGVDRGAGRGVRLYASKDLGGTSFGASPGDFGTNTGHTLRTAMGNMLIIDQSSYQEAIEQLFTIWRNWAKAAKPTPIEPHKEIT